MAIVALTFNPNDYKQKVIDLVQEKKGRTLKLDGDIKLAFWPKIGADLGKISLSEHQNNKEFAAVEGVKVSLALLPLLKKELIVDTIYIDGAKANIVKYKDGTTNFDDLLSNDDQKSQDIKFDIDGINITNSKVSYLDEATSAVYNITKLNLKSGRIALAEPVDLATDFTISANQAKITADAQLKGNFLVDSENNHFVAKGLNANIKGTLLGGKNVDVSLSGDIDAKPETQVFLIDQLKLVGSGQFNSANLSIELNTPQLNIRSNEVTSKKTTVSFMQEKAGDTLKAHLALADIKGSPKSFQSAGITGDISALQGKRTLSSKFSSPFNGNLDSLIFDLPKLVGTLEVKDTGLPNGVMQGSFDLLAHADIKNELANSNFNLHIDDTKLTGNIAVASFKKPSIKFTLNADKLNLNKLLASSNSSTAKNTSAKPADLPALKALLLDGKLTVGSILYNQYQISGLNVGINADGEKLALSGLDVKVDDSRIKGNLAISQFAKPLYLFDLDIDQLDADKYTVASSSDSKTDKPLDLTALNTLNAEGGLRIGNLKYGKTKASNIRIGMKADGKKLSLNPLVANVNDSQINASLDISRFNDPTYHFNVNIDKLDADGYLTHSNANNKSSGDAPIDLSALRKLSASGEAKIGWLKLANVKTENVYVALKVEGGEATLSPFSANLYQGNMSGMLKVDARTTPNIAFKQSMNAVSIGPLMVDAINNDMLEGKGTVNIDITTQGNSVTALKKALTGSASLSLADGAIKGIDIAGSIRDLKNKVNLLKAKDSLNADSKKKTDFSELTASFNIKNGVAHNEDLSMKAPILRLGKGDNRGDIDIANETINYLAKPTIVNSLKGQDGADLNALAGFAIPIKITGSFTSPKYGMDFTAIGAALAKSNLLDKVGDGKGAVVKDMLNSTNKADVLKSLLNKNTADPAAPPAAPTPPANANANDTSQTTSTTEAPKSTEDQIKEKAAKKLKNLLKF